MKYAEIRPNLHTFDIINCEGNGWFWKLIGHTAGIYRNNDIGQVDVFESTQRGFSGKTGVQLNTASSWFNKYQGKVSVRYLRFEDPSMRYANIGELIRKSDEFIKLTRHLKYPNLKTRSGRWKLILSAWDWHINGRDILTYKGKDDGIFCTQLIVAWYIYCGLTNLTMDETDELCFGDDTLKWALYKAQEYEPDDMREGGKFEKILKDGISLSKEIEVSK